MKTTSRKARNRVTSITLGDAVTLQLQLQGDLLLGIGQVRVGRVPLRSAAAPIRPDFDTLDGYHYDQFRFVGVQQRGSSVILRTQAIGRPELFGELTDEYVYRQAHPSLRRPRVDRLDWILKPQRLQLDGQDFAGFSLAFAFSSRRSEIRRIITIATWEIGGRITGNTLYHQAQVSPPVYRGSRASHFSTACLKRLTQWDDPMGMSLQMLPRWGCLQPFDFLAARQGVLLGYWDEPHSVKSLVQKNVGEDVLFVVDEHDFALSKRVQTPAKHILFSAGSRQPHDVVDLWTRASDHVGRMIRGFFGVKPSDPALTGEPHYAGRRACGVEEGRGQPQPDFLWRIENGRFYYLIEGDKIESHDWLYWLADKKLPRLHAQGLRRVYFEPVHESDFTELGMMSKAQMGWHGDLVCASVCGTHRYVPAEFFGGWKAWQYLADKAQALDMKLGHWIGLHLTPRAAVLRDHPEYILQHLHTLGHSGGYGHNIICSINWASGARQWFLDDLKRWHDAGLDWVWFDSWSNLACTPINFGGRCEPMQLLLGSVLAELQKIGFSWFGFEGTSPFGVHQYGSYDSMADYERSRGGVVGQNDFGWYVGHEYMGYNQALMVNPNPKRSAEQLAELSFRFIANRSLTLAGEQDRLTYQHLQPLLRTRYMLAQDRGVRWQSDDGRQVLFAYKAFSFRVGEAPVWRVQGELREPVSISNGVLAAQPRTAYVIG